jgi:galactonate dehydratase
MIHEWVEGRVIGCDPFDVERVIGNMIRDQYQGGATVMTAISSVEIALWDIIGKACNQPIYRLIGGRYHAKLPAYANGWYGNAHLPNEYAEQAAAAVERGYTALKFDPFGVAWKGLTSEQFDAVIEIIAAVRERVGERVQLMIEFHGRLGAGTAIRMMRALERFHPAWCEEPVAPESLDLLAEVKSNARSPISTGERLYTMADFYRLISLRAADIVQMDVAHCGGIHMSKKIAALAAAQDMQISPHCSIGPVALAAALHVDVSTPNFLIQEAFADFDVPWRSDLVRGWNPIKRGEFFLTDAPGLGLELDDEAIAAHPYVQNPFPSLWDADWITDFKQDEKQNTP